MKKVVLCDSQARDRDESVESKIKRDRIRNDNFRLHLESKPRANEMVEQELADNERVYESTS